MAKTKISEFSTTAGNNTDINSINIAEGCAPSGINDAIRELMRQLKEFQTGGAGDSVNSGGDFSVATNKFTVASASGNTSVAGTLGVTGTTTLTGALVANGNATLGDASGDTVTIKGTPTLEVNPTLSGGTANGVLYLNGSKVATSGSALTFDGTNFSATGTTTVNSANSSQVALVVKGETGNGIRQNFIGQASSGQYNWQIGASITAAGYFSIIPSTAADGTTFSSSAYSITPTGVSYWSVGGSEAMRLTGTGLGVGTSSPGYKLDVQSSAVSGVAANFQATAANTYGVINITGNSRGGEIDFFNGSTAQAAIVGGTGNLYFYTNGNSSLKATLDSSGNLGLGVTPSAWGALGYTKPIQLGNTGAFIAGFTSSYTSQPRIIVGANSYFDDSADAWKYIQTNVATQYRQYNGVHQWHTAASGTAGDPITFTQAMTLDASGNLLVGTTSPLVNAGGRGNITVNGSTDSVLSFGIGAATAGYIYQGPSTLIVNTQGARAITFENNGAERARIDSSGNLLVNTTSTGFQNNNSVTVQGPAGYVLCNHVDGTGSGAVYAGFAYNGSGIGSITQSGTTAVLYNTTSDQRLKENIVDAPEFGSVIDAIKVRSYDWKSDQTHQRAGFVAQELVTVAPEAVHQPADPEEMMAVDYSKLVPMLVKEIQSLRARVAALES